MRTESQGGKRKSTATGLESSAGQFAGVAGEAEKGASHRPPEGSHRGDAGASGADILLADVTRLSADQNRTLQELTRLYHSLCGAHAGQYWPQALLDTAGKFNRPPFPPAPRNRPSED